MRLITTQKISALILLSLFLSATTPFNNSTIKANAPVTPINTQVMTVAAINALVQGVLSKLNDLVTTIGGTANESIGVAGEELKRKLDLLNDIARDHINEPLTRLSLTAQDLARRITSSVEQLNFAINSQRECLFQNAEILLSTIRNIGESLKRGIPFIKTSSQLSHFQFDNNLPFAVPLNGGKVTILGSSLWIERDLPPIVELQTGNGLTTFQSFQPQRAANDDSVAINVDGATLRSHIGECLQFRVQARHREGFIIKRIKSTDMTIPICISQKYNTEFLIEAEQAYDIKKQIGPVDIEAKGVGQTNDICEHRVEVHKSVAWALPSGDRISDATILTIREQRGNNTYNQQDVTCTVSSRDTVSCNGWLDSATCVCVPIAGCRRTHSSVFERIITPQIRYTKTEAKSVSVTSGRFPMATSNTQIRVLMPKEQITNQTTFSFKVIRLVNGERKGVIYQAPRTTVNEAGGAAPTGNAENLQIDGTFNPTPINGNSELIVTIKAPACSR